MILKIDSTLYKILTSKLMVYTQKYWYMERARVGNDCVSYVKLGRLS